MYFSIDFGDWRREALSFTSTDELLNFHSEEARAERQDTILPEFSKIPVFRGVFRHAMRLASAQDMKIEVVFVKDLMALLKLTFDTLSCKEEYNDVSRKGFLELVGKAKELVISSGRRGTCLELYYDLN